MLRFYHTTPTKKGHAAVNKYIVNNTVDKTSAVVILNTFDYLDKMDAILDDTTKLVQLKK